MHSRWLPLFAWLAMAAASPALAAPLRVGVETDLVPISFVDAAGQPHGFIVDLLQAISREENLPMKFVVKPRLEMFADFEAGRIDAIANAVHTTDRDRYMAFSVTDLVLRSIIFVRKDGPVIRELGDLKRVRIAGISNSHGYEYLRQRDLADHFVPVTTMREGMHALADGRADVSVATRLFGMEIIRDDHITNLATAGLEMPELTYENHIVLHPDDRLRLAAINEGLAKVRASGEYDKIYEHWIGPLEPRPVHFKDLQPYILPTALVLLGILGVLLWQRRMLRLLAQHTRALRRSEERLTLVLEGGGHGLWDWNVAIDHVERNAWATQMLGYSPEEVPATNTAWMDLVHPDDRPMVIAAIKNLAAHPDQAFGVEYRMKARNGEWRWISSRGKALDRAADGQLRRAAGTHTDITGQKRAEEERVALQQKVLEAQKLESLGLLAGGIAHDFNNLLTVILGQATFLRVAEGEATTVESAVQQIESAARRAADLCRQMLVYAGGGSFSMQTVDLNALLTGIAPLLRHSVCKDAHLEFELAGDLPPVEADPTQLRQIVMNLVINASEALGASGGVIRITTAARGPTEEEIRETALVSEMPPGRIVCLSVSDTGSGMTPDTRTKIFEPFFTTKFTGRGLGLAAVLGIVRAHRGTFAVQTAPGTGSTFSLFLAASPRPIGKRDSDASRPSLRAPSNVAVLVADDEPAVLAMSVAVLRHHGYEVESATTGREAVEKFRTNPAKFNAVILDFTMPELNGVGALVEIRNCRPKIPAVLMSGFGAADALDRVPADHPPLFLQKPFAQHELLTCVAEAIALGRNSTGPDE
jgi:PAS domain S-box-containing protein